jgi:hypothetical protein
LRRLSRGIDASLRSALGAVTGVVMLLGLDGIDNYRSFVASLAAAVLITCLLVDPLTSRMVGHSESGASSHAVEAARGMRLLLHVVGIAALAVLVDELFARGIARMESEPQSFSSDNVLFFRKLIGPILLGIFMTLALTTLSWILCDEFVSRSRLPKIGAIGACSGALLSALYFLWCSQSPASFAMSVPWPDDATELIAVEHVALAAMLGLTGGLVIAKVKTPALRVLGIAIGMSVVTLAWSIGLYYSFDRRYEDLLTLKMFRCHAVVVFGWIVGLFAGPLGSIDATPHSILEKP